MKKHKEVKGVRKQVPSIGFHEMALEARASVVLKRGEAVRISYRTMERSVAQEARIDVSV